MIFIVLGVYVSLAVWILQRQRIGRNLKIILGGAFTVVFAILVLFLQQEHFLGDVAWYDRAPYRQGLLLFLMLLGMMTRYLASLIEERREKLVELTKSGQQNPKVNLRFDVWEFSYPLLFSVMTFGGLLSQIKDDTLTVANVVLSFQNGFFWQSLLKKPIQTK
jgi:hypothetical protein